MGKRRAKISYWIDGNSLMCHGNSEGGVPYDTRVCIFVTNGRRRGKAELYIWYQYDVMKGLVYNGCRVYRGKDYKLKR